LATRERGGDGSDAKAGARAKERAHVARDNHANVGVTEVADREGHRQGDEERTAQEEPSREELAEGGLPDRDRPSEEQFERPLSTFFGPEASARGGSEEGPEPRMVEEEAVEAGDAGFVDITDKEGQGDGERVEDCEEDVRQRRAEVAREFAT